MTLVRSFVFISATCAIGLALSFTKLQAFQIAPASKPNFDPPANLIRSDFPDWPYPRGIHDTRKDDGTLLHLPGSTQAYTLTQIDHGSIDWFPDQHPAPPAPVLDGKKGSYGACAQCHLIDGSGKPDTADLRGLSVDYIVQQIEDMKDDKRHASIPHAPLAEMIAVAKNLDPDETREAAEYFHSIKPVNRLELVEGDLVPATHPGPHAVQVVDPSGATEPIGTRIIEVPKDFERTELRDPTGGFISYVPVGSIEKGEELAKTGGGGKTLPCATCHGVGLKGAGVIYPGIAGHSATATGRQLYDFKSGTRDGKNAASMKQIVSKLSDEDIVDLSAYVASLQP